MNENHLILYTTEDGEAQEAEDTLKAIEQAERMLQGGKHDS